MLALGAVDDAADFLDKWNTLQRRTNALDRIAFAREGIGDDYAAFLAQVRPFDRHHEQECDHAGKRHVCIETMTTRTTTGHADAVYYRKQNRE